MTAHDVSIIIPCFNKVEYTLRCLETLVEHTPEHRYQVVLVDNASTDATPDLCADLDGDVVVIRNEVNLGFAKACNQGAEAATGRHLLFLNNDTEALAGWLEPLLAVLDAEPDVGAVGSRLLFPNDTLQHAGVFTFETHAGALGAAHSHYGRPRDHPAALVRRDLDVVTGACVAFRREAFAAAGGFDEGYWNGNEDVDLCIALRMAGWRVVYEPASTLYHHESVSGPERFRKVDENVVRLGERWGGRFAPEYIILSNNLTRPHPLRARTAFYVSPAPGARAGRRLDLERTIRSAKRLRRHGETVVIDPSLEPDPSLLDEHTRIGAPTPESGARYRLDLHPGFCVDRASFDHMMNATQDEGIRTVGPVLDGGGRDQSVARWLGTDAPTGSAARRRLLAAGEYHVAQTSSLAGGCILHRLDVPSTGRALVCSRAYAESPLRMAAASSKRPRR